MAKPAAEFTIITSPIRAGASLCPEQGAVDRSTSRCARDRCIGCRGERAGREGRGGRSRSARSTAAESLQEVVARDRSPRTTGIYSPVEGGAAAHEAAQGVHSVHGDVLCVYGRGGARVVLRDAPWIAGLPGAALTIGPLAGLWLWASFRPPHDHASLQELLSGALLVAVGFQVLHGLVLNFLVQKLRR